MLTTSKYLRYILVSLVLAAPQSGAQTQPPPQNPPAQNQQPFTLQVSTQLVIETVTVRDRNGKIIEDLTAKDFAITEDGVPQTISVFQFQKLDAPEPAPAAPAAAAAPTVPASEARQISGAAKRGDIKYQDRRLMVLYFDMSAMPEPDVYRAVFAAEKFIQSQMKPADVVAIMSFENGAVKVLQDFTDDRDKLIEVVDKLVAEQDPDEIIAADTGAAFGQDDAARPFGALEHAAGDAAARELVGSRQAGDAGPDNDDRPRGFGAHARRIRARDAGERSAPAPARAPRAWRAAGRARGW